MKIIRRLCYAPHVAKSRDTGKRTTVADVAAKAGVSLGTVSRVLNNRRGVDPQLRQRVLEASRQLRFVRAASGRPPSRETCPIITFVLSNREFTHPMHGRMLQGAEQYCEEFGYFVVFKKFDYTPETDVSQLKLPELLREHGIADCLILAGTNYPNLIEATENAGVPFVLYGNNLVGTAPRPGVDQARSDDWMGVVEAVRYLVRLGHKQVCFIGDVAMPWFATRYRAYLSVMEESGLEPIAQTVGLSRDNFSNGLASAEAILQRGMKPTAIVAASDHIAMGVWEHLRRKGLRVPDHMSLLGFDDLPDSMAKDPPLTTVRVPFLDLGRELARMAIEKAKSPGKALPETVLPTGLQLRGTTWPCLETVGSFASR